MEDRRNSGRSTSGNGRGPVSRGKAAPPGARPSASGGRKSRADVRKNVRLAEPFGSPEFYAHMSGLYGKLELLRSHKTIQSKPGEVMAVLDVFQQQSALPARVYEDNFFVLPEGDRRIVDRLMREEGVVEATVVFNESRFSEVDIEAGKDYTNADLIDRIFKPCSPLSVELIDPAVYASVVPGETLADLFSTSSSVKSALIGTLWVASDRHPSPRIAREREQALERYEQRPRQAREWDARTLGSLISRYASHENPRVSSLASGLTAGFISLFNGSKDLPALAFLKEQLEVIAVQPGANVQLRGLITNLNEVTAIIRKGPEGTVLLKKAEQEFVRFKGWKTHQK